jgi:anti-sigma B factor antagonist
VRTLRELTARDSRRGEAGALRQTVTRFLYAWYRMAELEEPAFSIVVARLDGRTVLELAGELDLATAPELEDALHERLRAGEPLVVDLRGLDFMDSSGVRALVAGHSAAKDAGCSLVIVRAEHGTEVDRVIDVSGIAGALGMVDEPPAE